VTGTPAVLKPHLVEERVVSSGKIAIGTVLGKIPE
jgi:hypothetical protein